MKKTDLKAGVLYGFQRGEYGSLEPMLLLDADRLYEFNRTSSWSAGDMSVTWVWPSAETRPSTNPSRYRQYGYLVAVPLTPRQYENRKITPVKAKDLATMVSLEQALDLTLAQRDQLPYKLALVNPRHLRGPYEQVLAQRQAAQEQQEAAQTKRRAAEREWSSRGNAIRKALEAHGIIGTGVRTSSHDGYVKVPLDQAEALLRLLGDPSTLPTDGHDLPKE